MKKLITKDNIVYVLGLTTLLTVIDFYFTDSTLPLHLTFLTYLIGASAGVVVYTIFNRNEKSSIDYEGDL